VNSEHKSEFSILIVTHVDMFSVCNGYSYLPVKLLVFMHLGDPFLDVKFCQIIDTGFASLLTSPTFETNNPIRKSRI